MKDKEFAVVDIGSNSLRLMTGCWEGDRWKFSAKELETTRLGYQIEETKHLSPEGIDASLAAMARWQARLGSVPVCAVATSAVRKAADGQAFLAEIRARFGWHCRCISGLEEAALSFCGAAAAACAEYTLPGVSQTVIITRMAGRTPVPEREGIAALAAHGATMVVFLSAGMLDGLQAALLQGAYTPDTPAALVYKATWPEEKVVRCRLGALAQAGRENNISKTALVLVGYFACSRYSSALMGEAWQYKMIALCYQTAALVQDADPVEDAEALADIDRVFDVEFCRANPETHGNELREGMIAGRGGSAEDWSACQKAIIKLALKYPKSMLRERAGVFYNTLRQRQNGQSNQKIAFASAFLLYESEPTQDDQKSFLQDSAAVQPLNKELRRTFIVDMASSTDFAGGLIDLTWWMLPPFVLLGLALAVLLVQRRWMLFFAAGTFFARIPLVFLTAPDTYFMYYLTPFIAGYAVAAAAVLYAVLKRKLKSERITG